MISSCVFYYKTAQIDDLLKSTINQGTANYTQISSEVTKAKTTIDEMNCEDIYSFVKGGKEKLNELEISVNELSTINSKIIIEYENFKSYSNGKDQIGSNTSEWKQLKATKKTVKKEISKYDKEAKKTIALAEGFQKYFDDSILPNVNYISIDAHKELYKKSVREIKSQLAACDTNIKNLELNIASILELKATDFPDLCEELDKEGDNLNGYYNELKMTLMTAEYIWKQFNTSLGNKDKVYSCSWEWYYIPGIQGKIKDLNQEINSQQEKINSSTKQIESLIIQLGN
jgi:hypothetical protein